jgi:pimeloyl-ACP methyl ester carboxylesterase
MKERVVTFGPGGILVGVITEPDEIAGEAVVVMSNVGLNHRVGPYRIWVELARRLAARGIPSLRFDVSGLGDSEPRAALLSDIDRSVLDLTDALDFLSQTNVPRFILVGLCSGTDNTHIVATRDERVTGAVFLDGYTYLTTGHWLRKRVLRWVSIPHWKRGLRRRFPQMFGIDGMKSEEQIFNREYPSRDQFEADLTKIVARGGDLLYVYSGETTYAYRNQFWDWMNRKDFDGMVTVEHYPKADHTYTFRAEREVMLSRLERWIVHVAGRKAPPASAAVMQPMQPRDRMDSIAPDVDERERSVSSSR